MIQRIERGAVFVCVTTLLALGESSPAVSLAAFADSAPVAAPSRVEVEAARQKASLAALPPGPLVDSERPRMLGLIDDAMTLERSGRSLAALETLASVAPGIPALARAASGWKEADSGSGKGIDALQKEWEAVGAGLRPARAAFDSAPMSGQSAFIRALAEQSLGQVDEHYAVAVDYGRFSGLSAGAYYLGRAEGQMSWALTLARLPGERTGAPLSLPALGPALARLEDDIVEAYAKPGATAQHTNFILANSSLKLARELDGHGLRFGALLTLLRSRLALTLATTTTPSPSRQPELRAAALAAMKRFEASAQDESIGRSLAEKALAALDRSEASGEAADRERLRAAALIDVVIPACVELTKGRTP